MSTTRATVPAGLGGAGTSHAVGVGTGVAPAQPAAPATDPGLTSAEGVIGRVRERLAAAAAGGLDAAELGKVWNDLAREQGVEATRAAFQACAAEYAGVLSADGIEWLQKSIGAMEGHISLFQTVLGTHVDGARLLDDGDNQLDEGDWLISQDGTAQRLGEVLRDRVRIGAAVVKAAVAMARAGHDFELIKDHRCNEQLWSEQGGGMFTLKPGVKASQALMDFFEQPALYGFECATALVVTYYRAILDLIGPEDFDRVCADLRVGPWQYEDAFSSVLRFGGGERVATPERVAELDAGDYGYFRNFDVSDKGREAGWQGENIIYLGNGKFYGHPFGISTAEEIITSLNGWRVESSTRSAAMIDTQGELDAAALRRLDLTP